MPDKFSFNLAFSLASFSSYQKGEEYFHDGAVRKIWKEGEIYKARIDGGRRYFVSTELKRGEMEINCTCPFDQEGICKHAVAAILAFSKSADLSTIQSPQKSNAELRANELLVKANDIQIKNFLKAALIKDHQLQNDFAVFLHGRQETKATVLSYKEKVARELDALDLDDLLDAWYNSGDGWYDYYENRSGYGEYTLSEIIKPFSEEAKKYAENKNYGESIKINQAIIDALKKKSDSLTGDHAELIDWFDKEIDSAFTLYVDAVSQSNKEIKKIGIEYLCALFLNNRFEFTQVKIGEGLKQIITNDTLAKFALDSLVSIPGKKDLTQPESSLLTHIYLKSGDYANFEKTSSANLEKNPRLTLGLIEYYHTQKRKADLLKTAFCILDMLNKAQSRESRGSYQYQNIEIDIRRFLRNVFDPVMEYERMINNSESIFLLTGSLNDYKEAASNYKADKEKERFIEKMKRHFTETRGVKSMFKVFRMEDRKKEILELVKKYKTEDIFPEMIGTISKKYPKECFLNYQDKIKLMLKEADVRIYPQAAYHLAEMKKIGLPDKFSFFVAWIRTTYYRRRRLIEELDKQKL